MCMDVVVDKLAKFRNTCYSVRNTIHGTSVGKAIDSDRVEIE